jgi:transposase
MFVDISKNNGKDYIRLAESKRVLNGRGQKVSSKTVVLNVGPLDRFDDGRPNYVERLRESYKAGAPLIPALLPYCEGAAPREKYTLTFEEGDPECVGDPKLFAHALLGRIFEELGLYNLFSTYKGFTKIEYDVCGFARLLVFGRLLNPASKIATTRQNKDYHDAPLVDGFNPDNVYDTLDFIAENKDRIIRRINTSLVKKARRRMEIIYYDVTNFYFETEGPDDDEPDENGGTARKGLRKMGVSKENRKQPIVQMGLFMDEDGIPIAMESFPGNTLDHLTLRDALRGSIDGIDLPRFILVGDRGICMYPNLLRLADHGDGYIVAKSLLKSAATERVWAYGEEGYTHEKGGFKYKSRVVTRKAKDEGGNMRAFPELVVVYWSEKYAKKQLAENRKFLEFVERLLGNPSNFRVTATQARSLRKYLRNEVVNEKTGEVLDSSALRPMVDTGKIDAFKESMGYYQIVTSELGMHPKDVIDKYHGLARIEDQFRAMKGSLGTRPVFVRGESHIEAHLLVCTVALIMMRVIQNRIAASGLVPSAADEGLDWTAGLSAERVQRALNKWQVERMPGDLYRFLNTDDPDLKLILDAFGIGIPYKMVRRGELKGIKTGVQVFT